ncbi:MAG: hypothetical protein FGM24_09895 [Candidatus Kapabacteria bacterium]|nr:hypothetical protein [Candidatus Kapabacteria bacterium]
MMTNGYATTLDAAMMKQSPMPVMGPTLSGLSFDIGGALDAAAQILPDSWQKAGQEVIDSVTEPVKEVAKTISPELYAKLDRAAQAEIDKARSSMGLPPVNPESSATATGSTTAGGGTTTTTRTTGSTRSAFSVRRIANTYGYGSAAVGAIGGWWWTGRGDMKKSTGKRIGVSLIISALAGVAGGFAGYKLAGA